MGGRAGWSGSSNFIQFEATKKSHSTWVLPRSCTVAQLNKISCQCYWLSCTRRSHRSHQPYAQFVDHQIAIYHLTWKYLLAISLKCVYFELNSVTDKLFPYQLHIFYPAQIKKQTNPETVSVQVQHCIAFWTLQQTFDPVSFSPAGWHAVWTLKQIMVLLSK